MSYKSKGATPPVSFPVTAFQFASNYLISPEVFFTSITKQFKPQNPDEEEIIYNPCTCLVLASDYYTVLLIVPSP